MAAETTKPAERVETPKEMAARVGIPVSNVRYLIKTGQLAHVFTSPGRRNPKIPLGAWERYLTTQTGGQK
ncbi:hypothetical protein [Paenirhodobacter populi]|uniref:DNA-binding protein n=1 Tax=Paenirhodobacter populi TaxID=2306993 RepID=A0A451GCT9_9RHOB|nr:hypothetical protein [Sinirhodobacter populi]RWR13246.1 hypothetical protein D2T33_05880 [Sinirhodobacter populi]